MYRQAGSESELCGGRALGAGKGELRFPLRRLQLITHSPPTENIFLCCREALHRQPSLHYREPRVSSAVVSAEQSFDDNSQLSAELPYSRSQTLRAPLLGPLLSRPKDLSTPFSTFRRFGLALLQRSAEALLVPSLQRAHLHGRRRCSYAQRSTERRPSMLHCSCFR